MRQDAVGRGEGRPAASGVRFVRMGGLGRDPPDADDVCRAESAGEVQHTDRDAARVAVRGVQALQRCAVPQLSPLLLCRPDGKLLPIATSRV